MEPFGGPNGGPGGRIAGEEGRAPAETKEKRFLRFAPRAAQTGGAASARDTAGDAPATAEAPGGAETAGGGPVVPPPDAEPASAPAGEGTAAASPAGGPGRGGFRERVTEKNTVWAKIFIASLAVYAAAFACLLLFGALSGSPVFAIVLALADLAAFYSFFLSRKLRAHPAAKAIFVAAAAWLIVCNVVSLFGPDSAAYDAVAAVLNFLCLLSFFFIFEKSAYAQSLGLNVAARVAFLLHMILPLLMLFARTAAALVWLLVLEIVTRIAYLAFLGGLKKVRTHPVRTVLHDPRG